MNRLTVSIVFQNQNARSFRILRIIFDDHGAAQAVDDVTDKHTVGGKFFVALIRNAHIAARHERAHKVQGLAHRWNRCVLSFIVSMLVLSR